MVDFTISSLSRNIQIISHKSIACFCPIHPYQFYFCAFWYISWDVFHIGFSLTSSIAFLFINSIAIHQHCLLQFHSININTFIKYRLLAIFFWLRQCMERCLDACIVYGKLNGEWFAQVERSEIDEKASILVCLQTQCQLKSYLRTQRLHVYSIDNPSVEVETFFPSCNSSCSRFRSIQQWKLPCIFNAFMQWAH